ncbi:unnamed protein product [Pleuronectes platessa]|uniref:Uncharacterized protein n=1 Tax=Pleuronectes platessa TaxID=8262 RepID=A0A9N7Z959_PLEPL|nr:unnamed protein product [Pleuronectes platessa]
MFNDLGDTSLHHCSSSSLRGKLLLFIPRGQQSPLPASESWGSFGGSQVSQLIACLPVCSQSVRAAAMLAREEAAPRQDPSAGQYRETGRIDAGTSLPQTQLTSTLHLPPPTEVAEVHSLLKQKYLCKKTGQSSAAEENLSLRHFPSRTLVPVDVIDINETLRYYLNDLLLTASTCASGLCRVTLGSLLIPPPAPQPLSHPPARPLLAL